MHPYRFLQILLLVSVLLATGGCYSHAGQPYEADDKTWLRLAAEACDRGDKSACRALRDRASCTDPPNGCEGQPADHDNTSGSAD